jgi:hypothetical protein
MFTDLAFELQPVGTCDTPVAFYVSACVAIAALRFLGFARRWRTSIKYQVVSKKKTKKRTFTVPTALVLDFGSFFTYTILYLLIGFNVARADNGVAISIWTLSFLPFEVGFSMLLARLLTLGSKISPLLKNNDKAHATLSMLNGFGKFLRAVQYMSLFSCAFFGIVLVPAVPSPTSRTLAQATLGLGGIFMLACGMGIAYQLERTIEIIKKIDASAPRGIERGEDVALKKTFRKLRTNQALVLVVALPVAVFFLCMAGGAMRWAWYLPVIVSHGLETLSSLVLVFLAYHGSSREASSKKGSTGQPTPATNPKKMSSARTAPTSPNKEALTLNSFAGTNNEIVSKFETEPETN